jgi:hypothetical protein
VRRRSLIPPNLRKLRFVGIRDDRLLRGALEEEAEIRIDILFMKYFTRESPLFPSTKTKKCNSVILNEVKDLLDYSQFGVSKYVIV